MELLHPTPASRRRLRLAESLTQRYVQHANAVSILVGGSTARGQADQFSDLEIMVLWSEAPKERDRMNVVAEMDGDFHQLYSSPSIVATSVAGNG